MHRTASVADYDTTAEGPRVARMLRNLKGGLVFAMLTVNTVSWVLPLMLLALPKLLMPFGRPQRVVSRWMMRIAECWIACNAGIFALVNDTHWTLRGAEDLSPDEWYMVIVNHQSWADIVVLQTLFNRRIPLLKFFIKKQLMWFPFLGMAFWALDMPFMQRHSKSYLARHPEKKGSDLEATRRACEKFRHTPTSVINFVEGTRFSEEKRRRRGSPYRHLLTPRSGGVALAIATMGNMFSAILDVTVYYPHGAPRFWGLVCGDLDAVVVEIRRRAIEPWMIAGDYVGDREYRRAFHQWLSTVWSEKDERLEALGAEA